MVSKFRHAKGGLFDNTPRGILEALLAVGGITVVLATAPALLVALSGLGYVVKANDKASRRRASQHSSYLKRNNYLVFRSAGKGRVRISLSERGKRNALKSRVRRLLSAPLPRPTTWDQKWRIIFFDIAAEDRHKRNAFRMFIKRIGAVMLQKSVWVHPFDCTEQIGLLREFFTLSNTELRLVVAGDIGDDAPLRKHFKL